MQEVKNDKKQEQKPEINQSIAGEEGLPTMGQDMDTEDQDSSNNDKPEKPKIYFVELMFIFPILIIADVLDLLSLTGVGIVFSWLADFISATVITTWLVYKKRNFWFNLIANLLEFIPTVDVLPIRTTALVILLTKEKIIKRGKKILKKAAIN